MGGYQLTRSARLRTVHRSFTSRPGANEIRENAVETLKHHTNATLVIRPSLALALVLAFWSPALSQSADPPAAPMASMKPGDASQGARQAASMTEMMGAPGLVPFDVMTGQAGKWMVGYQFMFEKMDGNLVGTGDISEANILQRFFAAPTDMTMQMHMGMVMYAPTDKLTLMALSHTSARK